MSERLNIEELFNKKLEGLEIEPSGNAWLKTQRRLRRKEFLRFRARKFNLFYAVGLVVVGVGLASLLVLDRVESSSFAKATEDAVNVERSAEDQVIVEDNTLQSIDTEQASEVKTEKIAKRTKSKRKTQKTEIKKEEDISDTPKEEKIEIEEKEAFVVDEVKTMITYFTASVTEGCAPLEVVFTNHSENAMSYNWSIGEDEPSYAKASEDNRIVFEREGEHTVTLTGINSEGIQQNYSVEITVYPRPVADFEIDEGHVYNYSVDAIDYKWSSFAKASEDKNLIFSTEFQPVLDEEWIEEIKQKRLLLTVTNSKGCMDTMSSLLPLPPSPTLTFPTAFSPNPSGPSSGYYNPNEPGNEIFHPRFNEEPIEYHLTIYNRAGELIFQSKDIFTGWDGYHREAPVLRGVYIWKCTGKWSDGTLINKQGDITTLWKN